jgi:Swiss Army Knife RNA repair-like protein
VRPVTDRDTTRPLLLVDVDGVLSIFGAERAEPGSLIPTLVDGVPHLLSRTAAATLQELVPRFDCVWCTGWKDRADTHLPHLLGLPRGWPHVRFADRPGYGGHWKLGGIDAFAGPDRALVWIDDHHDAACRAWARARPGPTLLVTTAPDVGLTVDHLARVREWLDRLDS